MVNVVLTETRAAGGSSGARPWFLPSGPMRAAGSRELVEPGAAMA